MKQHWPAPERNKGPILELLARVLPERGTLLEIASGSGQHAAFMAAALPEWTWIPSDLEPAHAASVDAHRLESGLPNLAPARVLDVCASDWDVPQLDAVFSANMIHIAPFACSEGLFAGAARHLRRDGQLIVYGPMKLDGQHTAPSNVAFDADLRRRDARWGVRDLVELVALGAKLGLSLRERTPMPANNQCLVFERG
jgi:cyclopropane fatty-acyl-phospholipid synthase-like methyltransferase